MADDSAEGRRLSPNLIAGAIIAAFTIAAVLWQQPWQGEATTKKPPVSADAGVLIASQIRSIGRARTEQEFVTAAGDSKAARDWSKETYANISLLGATDIRLRFVSGGASGVRADGGTEAKVEVSWRPGPQTGLNQAQTGDAVVTFVLDPVKNGKFAIRDTRRDSGALPLWLAGKLDISRGNGSTVISIDGGDTGKPIADEADIAHAAVRKVVKSVTATLVVISPHTQQQTAALLDQSATSVEQIAAVTTTLDDSSSANAATLIVLNPLVFEGMDERAAQIVMSHEATHLMTKAVTADIETWVAEGFADFVALHDDAAPLSVSAGQILRSVKKDGAPAQLPTAADFGTTQHGLGGTYESAWLIFRMLGERYADADIVRFYDAVLGGTSTAKAAESAFGLSIGDITGEWRAYLAVKSASITS